MASVRHESDMLLRIGYLAQSEIKNMSHISICEMLQAESLFDHNITPRTVLLFWLSLICLSVLVVIKI